MESSTIALIVSNQQSARENVEAEIAEFAAIAPVGDYVVGSTAGGQGRWAIITPAVKLTKAQRTALEAAGFRYGIFGLGDGRRAKGWGKSQ